MGINDRLRDALAVFGVTHDEAAHAMAIAECGHVEAQLALVRAVESAPHRTRLLVGLLANELMLETCLDVRNDIGARSNFKWPSEARTSA